VNVRPITDPVEGEQVVESAPEIAPVIDAGWRRRLNLFAGRALSDTALRGEQEGRAGRLATAGQTFSHGVVHGLQVAVEAQAGEPVRLLVSAGLGLTVQGEDVVVPRAVRVPLDDLWVYLPFSGGGSAPPSGGGGGDPAPVPGGGDADPLPGPAGGDDENPGPLPNPDEDSDPLPHGGETSLRLTAEGRRGEARRGLPALPALPSAAPAPRAQAALAGDDEEEEEEKDYLEAPTLSPPVFKGPWSKLMDEVAAGTRYPLPRAMVLVLQPIVADEVGEGDSRDPCEQDPAADAFADWRIVDGCRLVLYAWPWPQIKLFPDPSSPTWRNQLADVVFRLEAGYAPGQFHPWEEVGVPIALIGFGQNARPVWVDAHAVVRGGGKPRTRGSLVSRTGTPFLWQARLKQFAEQAAGLPWGQPHPFTSVRYLPPAGILPRQAIGELKQPGRIFPPGWQVEAVPIPLEQLDAAFEASAALRRYDRTVPVDQVRLLVPVPGDVYHPRLLKDEEVSPEFGKALTVFQEREDEYVRRREELRRRAEALVAGATGVRPRFPRPEEDPDRVKSSSLFNPNPFSGAYTWLTSAAAGAAGSSEFLTAASAWRIGEGDTVFAYVYLDPLFTPRELGISFPVSEERPEDDAEIPDERAGVRWGPRTGAVLDDGGHVWLGDVPGPGTWVRLEVPMHRVGAEGAWVSGMRFTVVGGKANWDLAGRAYSTDRVWMDDDFPRGSTANGGTWITDPEDEGEEAPPPRARSGVRALEVKAGSRFAQAEARFLLPPDPAVPPVFNVAAGDVLFAYVWLDPDADKTPGAVMLQWNAGGTWEHRAYWGSDLFPLGQAKTPSKWSMGALPPEGGWVRLEVPAAAVGLEGQVVRGMAFNVHGGRAVWDRAGTAPRLSRPRGTGLTGEYYEDANSTELHSSRVDPVVDFEWNARPAAEVGPGQALWSARWVGQVMPVFSEDYVLVLTTSGPAQLYLDGAKVIDTEPAPATPPAPATTYPVEREHEIRLDARRRYDLRLDYRPRAHDKGHVRLEWRSPNTPLEVVPTGVLFPSATAGGGTEVPRIQEVWVDDVLPPGSYTPLGWTFPDPAKAVNPPEGDYGTVLQGDVRVAVPLQNLRQALQGYPMRADQRARLDQLGLEKYVEYLDATVRRCDDVVNFGFVRVQSDVYRFRRLMLGTTSATRLATSPALAQIINEESAVTVRDKLVEFLDASGLRQGAAPAQSSTASTVELAAGSDHPLAAARTFAAGIVSAETMEMRATLPDADFVPAEASRTAPISRTATTAAFLSAGATADLALAPKTDLRADLARDDGGFATLARREVDAEFMADGGGGGFSSPVIRPLAPRAGATDDEVLRKQPIVGETYNFRTVTVGERLETPRANEAKSYTLLTRYEVLRSLLDLDILLDDINIPGFVSVVNGQPEVRQVTRPGNPLTLRIARRVPRALGAIRYRLEQDTLYEPDPDDADEPRFYSVGVELLDATIAALRAVEGRVQQYRDALNRCRATLNELRTFSDALAARLKTVEGELAEARHDYTVTQALLDEENKRVEDIKARRLAILRQHVTFLAFHRPRAVHGTDDAPVRPLDPAFRDSAVPACLATAQEAPAELRRLVQLLREAPVRWFQQVPRLLDALDRVDMLHGVLGVAKRRAGVLAPPAPVYAPPPGVGRFADALGRRYAAQESAVWEQRRGAAELDLAVLGQQGWRWAREQAERVVSLGDLIEAAHGRTDVDRGAARELDDVLRVATCLYSKFGEVLPSIRLDWAERLSQYDDVAEMRSLYVLPRWGELEYLDRREMQSMVDWLFQRVNPRYPQSVAIMNDIVRSCLLLASHAPVNQIVAADVARQSEVRVGSLVPLAVDLRRVRIGMYVLMKDAQNRQVHGVVEDIVNGQAIVRVVQGPPGTVTLPPGTRVQLGDRERLAPVTVKAPVRDRRAEILDGVRRRVVRDHRT
jgi:hypothetical protein